MEKILYINGCVRDESRTNYLAKSMMKKMNCEIMELRLADEHILPLNKDLLNERNHLLENNNLSHPSFDYAKQFAKADQIVIAAPYWDLSFPAILKVYFERINVLGITFCYTPDGFPKSLCAAKKLTYITTAGGMIIEPNAGYLYIKQLSEIFYGIHEFEYYKAEGLDVVGADIDAILKNTEASMK